MAKKKNKRSASNGKKPGKGNKGNQANKGKGGAGSKKPSSSSGPVKLESEKKLAKEAGSKEPPKGFNRIPYWLKHEKGMSDFVASAIVLLAGGVIVTLVAFLLTIVWPAR
jgi:hypothetical protein